MCVVDAFAELSVCIDGHQYHEISVVCITRGLPQQVCIYLYLDTLSLYFSIGRRAALVCCI